MHRSYVSLAEDIGSLLLRFPDLTDRFRQNDVRFVGGLEAWLKEGHDTLKRHGIAECARLAGFRAKLFVAPNDGGRRRLTRKAQIQIASEMMFDVQDTLLEVYKPIERRLNSCRDVIRPLLEAIRQTGMVKYSGDDGFNAFLDTLWNVLRGHDQLKSRMSSVLSLVSEGDARRLVAETLDLENWNG